MSELQSVPAATRLPGWPSKLVSRLTRPVELAGAALSLCAMAMLALRAALRLETRWDTFAYHLPFAALRGGLHIPYELTPYLMECFHGFPPLPEFLQGVLWRLTGSMNATGVVNYLAFALFLFFAWRRLHARLWAVAALSLTAPMVLIHAASSYVDLFGNSLLAIGVSAFLAMSLFDRWLDAPLLNWGLAGLAGAAWSKFTTMPAVLLVFLCFLGVYAWRARDRSFRRLLFRVLLLFCVALLPYVKNIALYGNPTWPGGIPALKGRIPTLTDTGAMRDSQSPPPLKNLSQSGLFFHSLFEIDHPTSYPDRERWIIDQGNAWMAYRSGGFWAVGVVTAALAAILLGFLSRPRNGFLVAGSIAVLWCFTSVLPQSHELRYFLFLPLTVAATVGMLIPRVRAGYPATVLAILCVVLCQFVWISKVNRSYYRVERVGYLQAAETWGASAYWKEMQPGKTYCAVGFEPIGFMLTGPTLHEFHIVDRKEAESCPPGIPILRRGN
jgi:hypothetical protein